MKVIQLKNLSKVYNWETIPVPAVNGVTLSFESGEFTAIVGASGSGKTTLLNLIGGIDSPTGGEVWIGDKQINTMNEKELTRFRRDHIGFIFQNYNLLPVLTARENVEFILELQGVPKAKREHRATQLLGAMGLADKLEVKPAMLSGGQQQRVAIARALAHKPAFIIADEPTANLDSRSTTQLLSIMEELNRKEGITFLFSTHDGRVVERARRIITFEDGLVQQDLER